MSRSSIVSYCRDNIGCAYDYRPSGGVEGSSYNCSYLSYCAYKAAGLDIPGWQGHQNGDGSQSDCVRRAGNWTDDYTTLLPGDLVFFGYYDEDTDQYITNHVGIVSQAGDPPLIIDSTPSRGVAERELPVRANFVGGGWPFVGGEVSGGPVLMPAKGTVRFQFDMNVRDYPSTVTGNCIGDDVAYHAGETCNIDGICFSDSRVWGHYIGLSSGKDRYVALHDEALAFVEVTE